MTDTTSSFGPIVRRWLEESAAADSDTQIVPASIEAEDPAPKARGLFTRFAVRRENLPEEVDATGEAEKDLLTVIGAREDRGVLRIIDENLLPADVEFSEADRARFRAARGELEAPKFDESREMTRQVGGLALHLPAVGLSAFAWNLSLTGAPALPLIGAVFGSGVFVYLGARTASFSRAKKREEKKHEELVKLIEPAWVSVNFLRIDTPEGVAAATAVFAGEGILGSPAYSSFLLDSQRARLDIAEEVRQTILSASRIARLEAEIEETEKILTSPDALRAIRMQRDTLDAGRRSVAKRAVELRNYALGVIQLEGQIRELEALTRLEVASETIDVVLRGIFSDEEAAKHLSTLSAETRAIADGVRDTIALLSGPAEALRAISERTTSR